MKLGFTVSEISSIFDKSIHTIYRHCSNIRKKMNIPETESITDFFDKILYVADRGNNRILRFQLSTDIQ